MKKKRPKELTLEAFSQYGSFANMINPQAFKLGCEPIEFYRDMVQLDLGGKGIASFSTCRVLARPMVVNVSEYHTSCGEVIMPLDGDVLLHVGPATNDDTVPVDQIEIFRVPSRTLISLRPGMWHHVPFTDGCEVVNVLIVLPERIYANDCKVQEITGADQIQIEV